MNLANVLSWIICGAVVGSCVRLAVHERRFVSLPITIGAGVIGAMLGQIVYAQVPLSAPSTATAHYWGGWIVMVLSSLFLVWIYPYIAPRSWQE